MKEGWCDEGRDGLVEGGMVRGEMVGRREGWCDEGRDRTGMMESFVTQ